MLMFGNTRWHNRGGSGGAPTSVAPPAYTDFSNVKFLSALNSSPATDEATTPVTLTNQNGAAPDVGTVLFGAPMTELDGVSGNVAKMDAAFNEITPHGTSPYAGFMYYRTPPTVDTGTLLGYIEKSGVWHVHWLLEIITGGFLRLQQWSQEGGGGNSTLTSTSALVGNTTYLLGFSKDVWFGGQDNVRLFQGKTTDPTCSVVASEERGTGVGTGTIQSSVPKFMVGAFLVNGVVSAPLAGHFAEAVILVGEPYVTADFPMPTERWPRA
jgi:hypothetical protein